MRNILYYEKVFINVGTAFGMPLYDMGTKECI